MAAEGGALGHHIEDGGDGQPVEDGHDVEAADFQVGDLEEALGHGGVGVLGQVLGDGAEDLHGAQGGDEGGQLAVGDEHAVEPAQQRAEDQAHGDGDDVGGHAGDAHAGQQAGGAAVHHHHDHSAHGHQGGADGQINAAGDDDEGHAQGDDAHGGVVAQDVEPVGQQGEHQLAHAALAEVVDHDGGLDDDHQDQHQAGADQGVLLPGGDQSAAGGFLFQFFRSHSRYSSV